ncbi:MAG: CPBP family intramembrane metalloprotease [Dehalococcoidia bacterium]|nr:CPBP family intramembrane metalloprotease [Dehalococcoidia bacterium]
MLDPELNTPAPADPKRPARLWQMRDLVIGVGLLLMGYAAVIAAVVVLASLGDPDTDSSVALGVAVVTLGFEVWLGAIVLILATNRRLTLPQLGFLWPGSTAAWWIPATVVGAYAIVLAYGLAILLIEEVTGADLGRLVEGNALPRSDAYTDAVWLALGLSVVVAAPLGEELFFRAFLFRAFAARWGLVAGMITSGALFALVHFEVSVVLPFWVIGMWFAWTYHRSGSLWTTIAAHAIFNGISFAVTVSGVTT